MIDLSKKWQTEFGHSVILLSGDGPDREYPIVGYLVGETRLLCFSREGEGLHQNFDLVEVKEKIVVKAWVNIFKYLNSDPRAWAYHSEEDAKKSAKIYREDDDYIVLLEAEPFEREIEI